MKVNNNPEFKTARQWAKQGFLPIEGASGIELWANHFCQDKYIYYSPEEVAKATNEQLSEFFRPERERRNRRAKEKLKQREIKIARERELEREQKESLLSRIAELQRIISVISTTNAPNPTESKTVVIDTETTGLDPIYDELLQISIIDSDGNDLFNSYVKPCAHSWEKAERVNKISPDMVKNAPTIGKKIAEINEIMRKADKIIGYNTYFDIAFLENNGVILPQNVEIVDVMKDFAPIYGEWSDYFGNYKWQKLITCADYYGYDWGSDTAHDSLADCHATLFCYQSMLAGKRNVEFDESPKIWDETWEEMWFDD
jgi:DNA polymerase-3 subunit epsilon